ncbi:apolipoprotein N-acyltransferase [Ferrimonas marina]|uniref:Apolipoprotein N-acyltransferase n=1 Tax=Ferrimonas marina TaxID=299255 RepID=A0A1M5V8W2_9GAMM|nr:apolipoprotein N-acyltransferase [Ferrimonas marina]SHH71699.1 apolipoprotein N-acyltransferase [Ferrimonas marina]
MKSLNLTAGLSPAFRSQALWRPLLAFGLGGLAHLAFAPCDIWWLLPLALAGLMQLVERRSPRQAGWIGLSWGFGLFAFGIRWVHVSIDNFGGMPLLFSLLLMALLCLYLAIYPALALYALNRWFSQSSLSRWLAFPALWLLTEVARGWMLTGFPWLWSGYSQLEGPLSALLPIVGVLGTGLVISALAAALPSLLQRRWGYLSVPVVVVLMTLLASLYQPISATGKQVDVALVQGDIPQSLKWEPENLWPTLVKYQDLSRPHFDADLIIWPEAAIPAPEHLVREFLFQLDWGLSEADAGLITGLISMDTQKNFYNSLMVLGEDPNGPPMNPSQPGRYHKHQLLPIGEFVPLEDLLRPLAPFFNLPMSSFQRGDALQPNLLAGGVTLAPAICYEIAFPELVRQNTHEDTDLLLTVSNDAWFGDSIGPIQHMAIAQARALELGRPLLRVTNNGITAVVDHQGRITEQLPQFTTGVLRAPVELVEGRTLFAQWGQRWLYLLAIAMLLLAVGLGRRAQH